MFDLPNLHRERRIREHGQKLGNFLVVHDDSQDERARAPLPRRNGDITATTRFGTATAAPKASFHITGRARRRRGIVSAEDVVGVNDRHWPRRAAVRLPAARSSLATCAGSGLRFAPVGPMREITPAQNGYGQFLDSRVVN